LSDGTRYENHKYLEKSLAKLRRQQRRLSRKQKGSRNRERQRVKVARIHERVTNQRSDAIHKATTDIIRKYDVVAVENLSVEGMARSTNIPGLPRRVYDTAMGEFLRQIKYKAVWYGREVVAVAQGFPSTGICSQCGTMNDVKLSQRTWTCPDCSTHHDRDINAARNILTEGLRLLA
jgi:putative transposase